MSDQVIETRETYDLIAEEYARVTSRPYPDLADDLAALRSSLAPGARVADVGCGPGRDTRLLREQRFGAVGLDLSMGQLQAGGLAGVAQADMRQLPILDGALDAVWCRAALLHVPQSDVAAVLAEISRVLRSGGWLYLVVAEGDGAGWEIASTYGSERRRWFTYHRESGLVAQLTAASLQVEFVRHARSNRRWLALRCLHVRSNP